jgi:hypothetical protein
MQTEISTQKEKPTPIILRDPTIKSQVFLQLKPWKYDTNLKPLILRTKVVTKMPMTKIMAPTTTITTKTRNFTTIKIIKIITTIPN